MYNYCLQINASDEKYNEISCILGMESSTPISEGWRLNITYEDGEVQDINFIDYFLTLLEGKYEALGKIGINREDIIIWMYYEYDSQCNMEFHPEETYRLGKEGITLCITCWDIHDYDKDYDEDGNVIKRNDE